MNTNNNEKELAKWFSSYGIITAQRLLDKYGVKLLKDDLIAATKNPDSIFFRLLIVPVKIVRNGILLGQVKDLMVYGQKLFIDYLLAGESSRDENSPGAGTRQQLEDKKEKMTELAEKYNALDSEHQLIISETQKKLITFSKDYINVIDNKFISSIAKLLNEQSIKKNKEDLKRAIIYALARQSTKELSDDESNFIKNVEKKLQIQENIVSIDQIKEPIDNFSNISLKLSEHVSSFLDKTEAEREQLRVLLKTFYDLILEVTETLNNLSEYRLDPDQVKVNKESLDFNMDFLD